MPLNKRKIGIGVLSLAAALGIGYLTYNHFKDTNEDVVLDNSNDINGSDLGSTRPKDIADFSDDHYKERKTNDTIELRVRQHELRCFDDNNQELLLRRSVESGSNFNYLPIDVETGVKYTCEPITLDPEDIVVGLKVRYCSNPIFNLKNVKNLCPNIIYNKLKPIDGALKFRVYDPGSYVVTFIWDSPETTAQHLNATSDNSKVIILNVNDLDIDGDAVHTAKFSVGD